MKTNAVRALERLGVVFELRPYEVDASDLSAQRVARLIGLPLERVFKTLAARGDRKGVCLAAVPAHCELDLKALARLSGDRKVETVALRELQALTGYLRGAVTALGARRAYPVYLDESALAQRSISVSAGQRGLQVLLAPGEYVRATGARVGPIATLRT